MAGGRVLRQPPRMTDPTPLRRLVWSNLAAQAADQVALAATPLLAVFALGAGAGQTALLAAAQTLPFLLLSLPAGVLADRMGKRRLMAGAELVRAVALLVVPALAWAGALSFAALALLGAVAAVGTVMFSVAAPALVPSLVPRERLASANTQLELVRSLAFAAGPAAAGAVVSAFGGAPAFVLAAVISLAAVLLLAGLPEPKVTPSGRRPLAELAEGLGFVRGHALLRPIVLTAVVWSIGWFVLQAVYVPYAVTRLGLSAAWIGITLAAYGVGMVAGAMVAPALARHLPFGRLVLLGPAVSVAASAAMLASLTLAGPPLPLLAFFLFGAGPIVWTISQTTLRQAVTPPHLLGRASAVMMTMTFGARPLGAAIGGTIASLSGLEATLALSTLFFAAQVLVLLNSPVPGLRALPKAA